MIGFTMVILAIIIETMIHLTKIKKLTMVNLTIIMLLTIIYLATNNLFIISL
jgi:hypothetical protein